MTRVFGVSVGGPQDTGWQVGVSALHLPLAVQVRTLSPCRERLTAPRTCYIYIHFWLLSLTIDLSKEMIRMKTYIQFVSLPTGIRDVGSI